MKAKDDKIHFAPELHIPKETFNIDFLHQIWRNGAFLSPER